MCWAMFINPAGWREAHPTERGPKATQARESGRKTTGVDIPRAA
jgi:hypothetical protein